jgi:hypothetical protein
VLKCVTRCWNSWNGNGMVRRALKCVGTVGRMSEMSKRSEICRNVSEVCQKVSEMSERSESAFKHNLRASKILSEKNRSQ